MRHKPSTGTARSGRGQVTGHFHGWSFPCRRLRSCPLAQLLPEPASLPSPSTGFPKNYHTDPTACLPCTSPWARNNPEQRLPAAHPIPRGSRTRLPSACGAQGSRIPKWRARPAQGWDTEAKPRTCAGEARPRCACEASRMSCSCVGPENSAACSHPREWCGIAASPSPGIASVWMPRPCARRARQTTSAVAGGGWCASGLRRGGSRLSCTKCVPRCGEWEVVSLTGNSPRGLPEDRGAPSIPFGRPSPIEVDVLWLALDLGHSGNTRGTGSAASARGPGGGHGPWGVEE